MLPLLLAFAPLFSNQAQAAYSVEVTSLMAGGLTMNANPNLRNATCRGSIWVTGWIAKPATDYHGATGSYRWLDSNGAQAPITVYFGLAANQYHNFYHFHVAVPINETVEVWAQLELISPEHRFSNRMYFTVHCLPEPELQPIEPGQFPHDSPPPGRAN